MSRLLEHLAAAGEQWRRRRWLAWFGLALAAIAYLGLAVAFSLEHIPPGF